MATAIVNARPAADPLKLYWLAAVAVYGLLLAVNIPEPVALNETGKDIWQHIAALRALIESPTSPPNPFVNTGESSRLFGPVFALAGFIGHVLGWSPVQAYQFCSVVGLGLLAAGIFVFARAFFPTTWGPLALLATMLVGSWWPVFHTGNHSMIAIIDGAGYPALSLIGAGLLSWGLSIRLLKGGSRWLWPAFAVLIGLMFAQHQLGAGIAIIGIGAFAVAWPQGSPTQRCGLAGVTILGLALAALWPYFDPWQVALTAADPRWESSFDVYGWLFLMKLFIPAGLGLLWLFRPLRSGAHRPLVLMGAVFVAGWLSGLADQPVGHRFAFPLFLLFHILLATGVLRIFASGPTPMKVAAAATWAAVPIALMLSVLQGLAERDFAGNYLTAAQALTADLPSGVVLAGRGADSNPLAAAGHWVLAPNLPEPMIGDLARRQAQNAALFDVRLGQAARANLMHRLGIRALFVDERNMAAEHRALFGQPARVTRVGPYVRIEL